MPFRHDDFQGALAEAARANKLLFVDAWAEWCHTCKSMKSFVFTNPALAPLAESVVFLAIDTDKPDNAQFLEKYDVRVWPSLFAIDPGTNSLLGYWPGSASFAELREFLEESSRAREAMSQSALDPKGSNALLIRARLAHAAGDPRQAASLYARALERAPTAWPRTSEALHGRLWALAQSSYEPPARLASVYESLGRGACQPSPHESRRTTS